MRLQIYASEFQKSQAPTPERVDRARSSRGSAEGTVYQLKSGALVFWLVGCLQQRAQVDVLVLDDPLPDRGGDRRRIPTVLAENWNGRIRSTSRLERLWERHVLSGGDVRWRFYRHVSRRRWEHLTDYLPHQAAELVERNCDRRRRAGWGWVRLLY